MAQQSIDPSRRQGCIRPPLPSALLEEIEPLLTGGRWIPRCIVEEILAKHRIQLPTAGEGLRLAESDLGAFLCTPAPETPLEAPDEALAASDGELAKGTVIRQAVREWRESHGWPVKKSGPKGPRHIEDDP